MKPTIVIVLVFVAALASVVYAKNTPVRYGVRNATDPLLLRENVIKTPLKNRYQTVEFKFPKSGSTNNRTITSIYIYDQFTNGSGANPTITGGGVGYRFTTINLRSQYNQGINSTLLIYGKL